MKGFHFKLQPVLKVKQLEEDLLLEEYALLRKAHADVTAKLHNLISLKEGQLSELQSTEGEGSIDITTAVMYRNYLGHLRRVIAETSVEENQRKEEMQAGLHRLVEKTKERKILEKLREKHEASFLAEQLQTMQNELDDLAQGRFNHQKNLEAEL